MESKRPRNNARSLAAGNNQSFRRNNTENAAYHFSKTACDPFPCLNVRLALGAKILMHPLAITRNLKKTGPPTRQRFTNNSRQGRFSGTGQLQSVERYNEDILRSQPSILTLGRFGIAARNHQKPATTFSVSPNNWLRNCLLPRKRKAHTRSRTPSD